MLWATNSCSLRALSKPLEDEFEAIDRNVELYMMIMLFFKIAFLEEENVIITWATFFHGNFFMATSKIQPQYYLIRYVGGKDTSSLFIKPVITSGFLYTDTRCRT